MLLFYWFVKTWLFFFVVVSFWSNTIIHLFSTRTLRLRYRTINTKERKTKRTIRRDNTISRKRIVQLQQWVCYNDVFLMNLLQRCIFSEFATMMYSFVRIYSHWYELKSNNIVSKKRTMQLYYISTLQSRNSIKKNK